MRIILFLVLVDLEDMVSAMRRDQPPNSVFLQVEIDSAKKTPKSSLLDAKRASAASC